MVELERVSHRAGGTLILDDVSVRFRPGAFNVILGPNGAGKSTLLRIATGLATPTRGTVRYDDRAIETLSPVELARMRAVLSQHVELAFPLPAADVVMMGRYPHYDRVPTARDRDVVRLALDIVGMTDQRDQPDPTLSGGEQQKIQLARVLAQIWRDETDAAGGASRHRYLFLDEPTTSLDIHYQIHLLDASRALLARGTTVIAILHDINVALEYGDHFLLLDRGRVALDVDDGDAIGQETLERIFRVRARKVGEGWKFSRE